MRQPREIYFNLLQNYFYLAKFILVSRKLQQPRENYFNPLQIAAASRNLF